ncbi:SigE family RNA polymerase sigma factor [Streptomyces sp. AmelKG-E11A]|uniref:SigE family RNA polymerase sigma factor n=1 Tax=Streptomyces sp. AmelKG-E11A TaxID=1100822 RepID=UPI000823D031|nr:RNA polymerase sigma-70 factor, sigma-E family [Streptomyces sp. AmelKG-E11A]
MRRMRRESRALSLGDHGATDHEITGHAAADRATVGGGTPTGPAADTRPASPGMPAAGTPVGDGTDPQRDIALAALFARHYTSMLRLASLLGADDPENIVAEAYYQLYRKWRRLRNPERAEAYLRSVVCNLTRMRIRHLQTVRRHAEAPAPAKEPVASAEHDALLQDDQRVLIAAVRELPARQREALVLRHWMGLKEAEIADAMGISAGSVKTHTARGIAALTKAMEARR